MSKHPLYFVTGSKGGVGKSLVSMSVLDLLGPSAILVETDTSNPDVAKIYGGINATHPLDLDKKDGWIDLVNLAAQSDAPVVINGAARSASGMSHAPLLISALPELQRELVVFFVMSRARDSLELLADHLEQLPFEDAKTWVLLNSFFGSADKFALYHESKLKNTIEAKTGTLIYPDLADRVHDSMIGGRLTICRAKEVMHTGEKVELLRWCGQAQAELRRAIR